MKLDEYQSRAALTDSKRVIVSACPGAGKTRTVCGRYLHMVNDLHILPPEIVLLTFTRYASNEMRTRLGDASRRSFVGTFHAFALKIVQQWGHVRGWEPSWLTLLDEPEVKAEERSILADLNLIRVDHNGKESWTGCKAAEWRTFKERMTSGQYRSDGTRLDRKLGIAWRTLLDHLASENVLTFGALILESIEILKVPEAGESLRKQFRHVIADEMQDSDQRQWDLINLLEPETMFVVGDVDQCQPAMTKVLLANGTWKPIGVLSPETGDRLVTYDRHAGRLVGRLSPSNHVNRGYDFTKRVRFYTGNMHVIRCAGLETRATATHKWPVRFKPRSERNTNLYVVYLMRRSPWFRVGLCKLWNAESRMMHFTVRCRLENADSAWILGVFYDRTAAREYELFTSIKYGLPQAVWNGCGSRANRELVQGVLSRFPDNFLAEKAYQCLHDHLLNGAFPLYRKQSWTRNGWRTSRIVRSPNLIPNVMLLPVMQPDDNKCMWREVENNAVEKVKRECVVSLNVEKHQHYVVDGGIVTHNSIYEWRGARPHLFVQFEQSPDVAHYHLPYSYRFDVTIAAPANNLIRHNVDRLDTAIDAIADNKGSLEVIRNARYDEIHAIIVKEIEAGFRPEDIAVLSRTHKILDQLAHEMEGGPIPFRQIGSATSIPKSAEMRAIKGYLRLMVNSDDKRAFMAITAAEGLWAPNILEIRQLALQGAVSLLSASSVVLPETWIALKDYLRSKSPGVYDEAIDYVTEFMFYEGIAKSDVQELVTCLMMESVQDQMRGEHEEVTLMSCHASKGLQWKVVLVIGMIAGVFPNTRSITEGRLEEERRLLYVSITRAERKLYLIQTEPGMFEKDTGPSQFFAEMEE